jgi:hypothetical protein
MVDSPATPARTKEKKRRLARQDTPDYDDNIPQVDGAWSPSPPRRILALTYVQPHVEEPTEKEPPAPPARREPPLPPQHLRRQPSPPPHTSPTPPLAARVNEASPTPPPPQQNETPAEQSPHQDTPTAAAPRTEARSCKLCRGNEQRHHVRFNRLFRQHFCCHCLIKCLRYNNM